MMSSRYLPTLIMKIQDQLLFQTIQKLSASGLLTFAIIISAKQKETVSSLLFLYAQEIWLQMYQ